MKIRNILFAVTVTFVLIAVPAVQAQIRVTKAATDFTRNPTLTFNGISGSSGASAAMESFLRACGWFDVGGANSDLEISGSLSGGTMNVVVKQNQAQVMSMQVPVSGSDYRSAAKRAVDAILKKLFKIDGICNSRIVFCGQNGVGYKNIYITDIDGKNVKKITRFRSLCVEPEWFPDSNSIVYTKYNKSTTDIVQTMLSPRRSRRLASYPGTNAGASISPNGKYLALVMSKDRQVELYVKAVAGGAKRRLTHDNAVEASPCWSPGGGTICYVSDRTGRPQLYLISANGGKSKHLATVGGSSVTPAWSHNNEIVYATKYGPNYIIARIDLNGNRPSGPIVRAAGNWESPSWAPDNRHVVCSRTLGGKSSLWLIDTWTGKTRCLLQASTSLSMPAWSRNRP
ncbi:hypothetical protein P0136_08520 [Lentisphaerota bacterium ZTH]|nr:PD40 domain-containing protein [Lentisphaerota bacterium]WET05409.1 hypothetical protein P0136_08520 [Lentisphaerota bacterium ZTH]